MRRRVVLAPVLALGLAACVVEDDTTAGPASGLPTVDAGEGQGGEASGTVPDAQGAAPFDPPQSLTIATYNVENLFDLVDDPSHDEGECTPGPATWNAGRLADRMGRMAKTFTELNADIISVNEVENEAVLGLLRDAIADAGGPHYAYMAVANSRDPRGIKPSVLSRYPITRSLGRPINRSHDCLATEDGRPVTLDGSEPEARPIFQVEINVDADPEPDLILLANHWKAKGRTSYPCDDTEHRLRSGLQLGELMRQMAVDQPNQDVIALGDFNAFEFEPPLKDGLGGSLDLDADADIYNAWADAGVTAAHQSNDNRWNSIENSSYQFSGDWTRLDHLFLMRGLLEGTNGWRLERGSVGSFHPGYLLQGGRPNAWESRDGSGYSDHLPVRLRLVR